MEQYETPKHVARELAKRVPRRIEAILDPAVGTGALLRPLLRRLKAQQSRVVCIDVDSAAIEAIHADFKPVLGKGARIVKEDFLSWSRRDPSDVRQDRFDCVIMNPPFAGRKESWCQLDLQRDCPGLGSGKRHVPVEAAFILRGIRLLRPGGRLLAIVPGSVVSSRRTRWLREYLMQAGTITHVHELPQYTFSGVESRVYIFVFEKRKGGGRVVLCNHDLMSPEEMVVRLSCDDSQLRLDYGFHFARSQQQGLVSAWDVSWSPLGDWVSVHRGEEDSPKGPRCAVHTCDYHGGFWRASKRHRRLVRIGSRLIVRRGDILAKRVGRRCSQSFGRSAGVLGALCSDCVLVLRPKCANDSTRLLFAIRALTRLTWATPLTEKGTGAPYLSEKELSDLLVPAGLCKRLPKLFDRYKKAVSCGSFDTMQEVEKKVCRRLDRSLR